MLTHRLGLSDLARIAADRDPDGLALVAGARRLTWTELDAAATRAALGLLAGGAEAGDRVVLHLPGGAEFVASYLGTLRAGLVAVPVHPAYTRAETDRIRADCGARVYLDAAAAGALLGGTSAGADPRCDRGGEAVAALMYTSGTSGRPRAAMLSARAMLANLEQLTAVRPPLLGRRDVLLVPLPLAHVFGLNAGLGMALAVGATAVLADPFDVDETIALITTERVTTVIGVPSQFGQWLRHPGVATAFGRVRLALSGGAPLPPATAAGFARLGCVLHDGYGLTEAAPVVALSTLDPAARAGPSGRPSPVSIGRALPGVEVALRDVDGAPLESADDPGRIFVRGPNLFSGYWPDGAGGPGPDGWFGTGDIAIRDESGALHLVGRSTELIVVNGFNVYPAEVEAVLAGLPGVAEVAVAGVPDEQSGEAVRAYVVPQPGARLDSGRLLAAAAESLARFKLPRRVEVVAALPHSATGSVQRWRLEGADGRD